MPRLEVLVHKFGHLEHVTIALPPKTALRLSSALMFRLFLVVLQLFS